MSKTRLPSIPSETGRAVEASREILEIWKGDRGNRLDRVVTYRDLTIQAAWDEIGRNAPNDLRSQLPGQIDLSPPGALTNLTANPAIESIILEWKGTEQKRYAYTEIWRSDTDNLGAAVLVGQTAAAIYADPVGTQQAFYYWVRAVSTSGVPGPYNATAGTFARTVKTPGELIDELSGKMAESELTDSLNARLDTIEGNQVAIAQEQETRELETGELYAQYTVKIDNNGAVAGYGLASTSSGDTADPAFSEFYVNADRFAVMPQAATNPNEAIVPFAVEGNKVYLNEAIIRDASIESAKIKSLAADKIIANELSAVSSNMGLLTAGVIRSASGRFVLDLNNEQQRIYDENGRLRVLIGRLT